MLTQRTEVKFIAVDCRGALAAVSEAERKVVAAQVAQGASAAQAAPVLRVEVVAALVEVAVVSVEGASVAAASVADRITRLRYWVTGESTT